jgi:hypothetical protein
MQQNLPAGELAKVAAFSAKNNPETLKQILCTSGSSVANRPEMSEIASTSQNSSNMEMARMVAATGCNDFETKGNWVTGKTYVGFDKTQTKELQAISELSTALRAANKDMKVEDIVKGIDVLKTTAQSGQKLDKDYFKSDKFAGLKDQVMQAANAAPQTPARTQGSMAAALSQSTGVTRGGLKQVVGPVSQTSDTPKPPQVPNATQQQGNVATL